EEGFRAAAGEREALRGRMSSRNEELEGLEDSYLQMTRAHSMQMVAIGLTQIMGQAQSKKKGAGVIPGMAGNEIGRGLGMEDFRRGVTDFRREVKNQLGMDDTAYLTALNRFAERRRNRKIAMGFLAAVAAVGGFFFWLFRQRSRAIEVAITARNTQGPSGGAVQAALPAPGGSATAPGMILGGNYRVERELGRGGMGLVFEAEDLTLRRKVAIKSMLERMLQDPRDLEMFLSEARLVAGLKHPNVVEIHSVLRENAQIYLVFEFVSGEPLNAILSRARRLSIEQVKGLARQIAPALDYAHSRKVIHRDLKPANIMVARDGRVKVMDFGIAHQARLTAAKLTRAESWGTPPYMAPEQELGSVAKESDLYAFAVCLYEMLTGALPFGGPNFLAQKTEMRFAPPSRAGLPPGLDSFMQRALQAEPGRRFHSAAELLAALESVH
ncbi:MAG: serine/threonine-protein kinase, partial [Elusimicrobiota bacterium]